MSSVAAKEGVTLTGSPVYRLKHKWTVHDFASTYLADSTDKATYPQLKSAWFGSSLDSHVEFRILLRPKGKNEKSQNYLSLYVEMKGSRPSRFAKSADVKYKISLLNERNEKFHSGEYRGEFYYSSFNGGWQTFLKHSVLQNPANGLLPSDQLTILMEIDVFRKPVIQQVNDLLAKLQVASVENVRASLVGLLDSSDHSDVLLVINKEKLPAHKTLLSAHSPVFRAMFNAKVSEENKGKGREVKINNMKLAVAKKLLRFIYTGEIENELEEYAEELFVAADKYAITRLKSLCSQFLCGQLNTENAAHLLAFADRHSVTQLKSTCVEYIRAHWEDVCLTPKWKLAQKVFLKELRQLKEMEKQEKGEIRMTPEETSSVSMAPIATEESSTVNGSLKYRLKYDWTIKDFASTYLADSSAKEDYPELKSAWFSSSLESQVKFRILLHPRGEDEESQNYLSLHLEMKRNRPFPFFKSADVKYKISLLNERNEKCHSLESRQTFVYPSDNWGDSTFLKHNVLQNPANGLLPGDQLTILVEIDVFPEPVIQQSNEFLLAKLKVESIENVKGALAGVLNSGDHHDVVLEVDGGTGLAAHKAILSAHSPVFSVMFKSKMSEEKEGTVMIPDLKVEVAQSLLRFIYTGEIEDDLDEYAEELLVAADKYHVARLKALCIQYLCGQVNTENAARLFALADRHSVGQLKSLAFDYIKGHLDDVLLTDDWLLVHELFTSQLRQLKAKQGEKRKTPEGSDSAK